METTKIALFKGKKVRRIIYINEWWFSVVDVVEALTDSINPNDYWYRMKVRVKSEDGIELSTNCRQLKLISSDGKKYETDCANTETMFRIVQSIPSPKAEPFKRWLAKVGYERIQEIEDPELATKRTRMLYKLKGYSESWIEKRMRGIAIREELTDEWQKRGVREQRDYEILTAEISKATFGMTPSEYKKFKELKRENLRDHMDDLELIFTMLGERVTTEISQSEKPDTFPKNQSVAQRGGNVAGNARKEAEKEIGRSVISKSNYLKDGYIALITVLVIGAVGVAVAVSLLLLGLSSSRTSFALEQSNQAKALANACSEEALQQIRDSTPFTGTGNLSLGQGTCTYTVTSQGGQNRTITSSGTVGTIVRKVKIILDTITPNINVTSWQELADF